MNFQYVSDSNGQTIGVFIPIDEWNKLKSKYKKIEQEDVDIPDWHKNLVKQRLEDYRKNPYSAINFDSAMDDLEELEDIKLYDEAKKGKQEFIDAEEAFNEIEEARKDAEI